MNLAARGERLAARTLKRAGYRIVSRNYTCDAGEIDLIARDRDTLVFVEVKTRQSAERADPEINVHTMKKRQLARAARFYLTQHTAAHDMPCRFDVVAVVMDSNSAPQVEHFVDAFHA